MTITQIEKLLKEASLEYLRTGKNREEVAHYATLLLQATKENN